MLFKMLFSLLLVIIIVYMIKKKINMGFVMLIASGIVILVSDMPLRSSSLIAARTLSSYKTTISLILVMYLIILLENIMQEKGMISRIVADLKKICGSNRVTASLLSAVIGLLPSLGGARFSCPLVEETVRENGSSETKAFINTWYRHVLMDGFILYPGIILAAGITNVSIGALFLKLLVFIIITAISGLFFGTITVKLEKNDKYFASKLRIVSLIKSLSPILVTIAIYMLTFNFSPYAMEFSLCAVNIMLFTVFKYNYKEILRILKKSFILKYIVIIVGVMVFKNILVSSSIMGQIPKWVEALPLPQKALFIILPMMAGALTGISVGFVSISFPILLALGLKDNLWYGAIAYAAGQIGQMITPLHLCNVITAEYFNVPLNRLIIRIAAAEIPVIIVLTLFLIFIV